MQHFRKNRDAPESDPARFVEAVRSSILNVDPEVWIASSKELVASLRDWMNRWNSRDLISDADLCKQENFIALFRGLRQPGGDQSSGITYTDSAIQAGLQQVIVPLMDKARKHWKALDSYTARAHEPRGVVNLFPFDPDLLTDKLADHLDATGVREQLEKRIKRYLRDYTVLDILQVAPKNLPEYEREKSLHKDVLFLLNTIHPGLACLFQSTRELGLNQGLCAKLMKTEVAVASLENGRIVEDSRQTIPISNGWTLLRSKAQGLTDEDKAMLRDKFRNAGFMPKSERLKMGPAVSIFDKPK